MTKLGGVVIFCLFSCSSVGLESLAINLEPVISNCAIRAATVLSPFFILKIVTLLKLGKFA